MRRLLTCLGVTVVAATTATTAIHMRLDIEDVPVARVIANLSREAGQVPGDGQLQWALGRAYAIAASAGGDSVTVDRKSGRPLPRTDVERLPAPRSPGAAGEPSRTAHLAQAVAHYRRAAQLLPAEPRIRLGLAWCLQQQGQTREAIAAYRTVINDAWTSDSTRKAVEDGLSTVTTEAVTFLVPLLDPVADRAEIRTLSARKTAMDQLPRWMTPIVIALHERTPGSALVDADARVAFDVDGGRTGQTWEWITPEAAWLVWDPRRSGRVSSGLQLFGSVTFWIFWSDGYRALAALDDDGDGWLRDAELGGLALWHDRNRNAVSDAGEVQSLRLHGVVAINCAGTRGDGTRVAAFALDGVRLADGTRRTTYDVILHTAAPRLTSANTGTTRFLQSTRHPA